MVAATSPIRIPKESMKIVEATCVKLEITNKTDVIRILIKAGAKAKGIKVD